MSISALTTDALNTIKGYSNQALDDAKRYTLDQIAKIEKDNNNLIKGADLTYEDISNYWDTAGSLGYSVQDPAGGTKAIRLYGSTSDNYISARRSTNKVINSTGRYRVSVWLKSNTSRTVQISFNRTTYDCAVTTAWKKFTFICTVSSIASSYQLFTIGGFGSIGSGVYLYAYQPEVVFEFTTEDYFNMLTGGGASQGLYIYNNKLWLNGEYMKAKSITADKLYVTDLSSLSATIGGWKIGSAYLYSTNNNIKLYSNGRITIGGATISSNSNAITIKYGLHVYNTTDAFNDGSGYIKFYNLYHVTSGGHLVFDKDGATLAYLSSSSRRYKDHIDDMTVADAEKILGIPVVWFKYKDGYLRHDDILVGKAIPGFYAEDVEKYYPVAAQKNEDGSVEDWNYRMLIPAMMRLIQELYKRTGGITKNE